ncbi:hypothetical protein F4827_004035 [Paraburkholderia bannensis]|uniref:Uncharacterized protein n=1 Tax=Paraburkholderia bannensis TaxID=765414 RepID=A0A7W9TZC4_9BURK|nr:MULTISPECIES: hypothetical protein [Paraburkholderia]MBB3259161.1 hypothetical protein [Paraburkholderia sp. WP4_3_2]MBB6104176.1 hypothetical protein [Paraburkholderia bannensis]
MPLTEKEIAQVKAIEPVLLNQARAALHEAPRYELWLELVTHLEPGLRIRAPQSPSKGGDAMEPPFPLDLYVALPADELRKLATLDDGPRAAAISEFGASFIARLRETIQSQLAHEVDLYAGVQGEAGTLAVTLDDG